MAAFSVDAHLGLALLRGGLLEASAPEGSDDTRPSSPGPQMPRFEGDSLGDADFDASEFNVQVDGLTVEAGDKASFRSIDSFEVFDMQTFAAGEAQASVVVSLAEALGFEAI